VGGFFSSFPVAGSFGRSALSAEVGAKSALQNFVVGTVVLASLLVLTPLFHFVPMACLGSIILVSLLNLMDISPFLKAFRVAKPDFLVMVVTFFITLVVNIEVAPVEGTKAIESTFKVNLHDVTVRWASSWALWYQLQCCCSSYQRSTPPSWFRFHRPWVVATQSGAEVSTWRQRSTTLSGLFA
jgi:hypothetical protein